MPFTQRPRADTKVMLVDDDHTIRLSYGAVLAGAGYTMVYACDGAEALETARREKPELIILDVDMPRIDGWETLRRLQAGGKRPPVLMMTGCVEVEDRVKGLTLGADDYLCKPCNSRELLARVHAVLRRSRPEAPQPEVLTFGALTVNLQERTARRGEQAVRFTRTEFAMLELLSRQPGQLVTRETMLEKVWGYGAESNTRTIDTHVWRLRQKLQDDAQSPRWIQSVPGGGGYRLVRDNLPRQLSA